MDVRMLLLTGLGIGRSPVLPGTCASIVTAVVALALVWLCVPGSALEAQSLVLNGGLILIALGASITCVRFGGEAEALLGRTDPGAVVADEVAGQAVALLWLPWSAAHDADGWRWNAAIAATSVVAFRVLDILKPGPIRGVERWPGGWGILADDLLAGALALAAAQLAARIAWPALLQ